MSQYADIYVQRNKGQEIDLNKLNSLTYDSTASELDEYNRYKEETLIYLCCFSRSTLLGSIIGDNVVYDQYVEITNEIYDAVASDIKETIVGNQKYIARCEKNIDELHKFAFNEEVAESLNDLNASIDEAREELERAQNCLQQWSFVGCMLEDSHNKLYVCYG